MICVRRHRLGALVLAASLLAGCGGTVGDSGTLNAATIDARADAIDARAENETQDSASQMIGNAAQPAPTDDNAADDGSR